MKIMQRWTLGLVLLAISGGVAQAAPDVKFDVSQMVSCRDISPPEYAKSHPGQRLIEAKIRLSAFVTGRRSEGLTQLELQMISRRRKAWIVDYLPKTTLATNVVGSLNIERAKESSSHLGLNVTGSYERLLKATGLADASNKNRETVKYEKLPELDSIASSGIVARGRGVYYKLRASSRTSLEGGQVFTLRMRVPEDWRSGLIEVTCQASCQERGLLSAGQPKPCGSARFLVAVYLQGDSAGQQAARSFTNAEAEVYVQASRHRQEIRKRALPTFAHRVGAALDVVGPRIPADWVTHVLEQPDQSGSSKIMQRLPAAVREAVNEYQQAKLALLEGTNTRSSSHVRQSVEKRGKAWPQPVHRLATVATMWL